MSRHQDNLSRIINTQVGLGQADYLRRVAHLWTVGLPTEYGITVEWMLREIGEAEALRERPEAQDE